MSSKFMSWTLKRPDSSTFSQYKQLAPGEPWYSKNYIDGTGAQSKDGFVEPKDVLKKSPNWSPGAIGFVENIEKNHRKIHAIGMHEFGISDNGDVFNMGFGTIMYPNGYKYNNPNMRVLNESETDIDLPVPTSLRYLMHTYPDIRWAIQFLATSNSSGDRVTPLLENARKPLFEAVYSSPNSPAQFVPKTDSSGNVIYVNAQDEFIRQAKKIAKIYLDHGFPITDIEIDMEKTTSKDGQDFQLANLLARVKNEVCIPLGLDLRVNLFAMTGEYIPSYYGWHNYSTIAAATDKYGRQAVDEFQLMTYDFSWGGSAPGPSTPLWWLEQVLEHVANVLPPHKTFIGNAGYGRRWPLSEQRMGVTFDYKQLMQAQNGMYVHNDGMTSPDGKFYFKDQDFIPFAGFNDAASDYQTTYLHVYDKFKSNQATLGTYNDQRSIERPKDYVTNYSKNQKPEFSGIQKVVNTATLSGNASASLTDQKISGGLDKPYNFNFYESRKAKWFYHKGDKDKDGNIVEGSAKCMKEVGDTGEDGSIQFSFDLPSAGTYHVVALVGFPYFGSDNFDISINGTTHSIGSALPDWYPFHTNPSWHYWDCGTISLSAKNTISVGLTNGAWIGGFVICSRYTQNLIGGQVHYPANLQKMKKRGPSDSSGRSSMVDANFPPKMTLTTEILRRPPRPAIIWEDMFGPHLKGNGFTEDTDLTSFPFYLKANPSGYNSGSGPNEHQVGNKTYCISGVSAKGYSKGAWRVRDDGQDAAHIWNDTGNDFKQLMLHKKFSANLHIEVDCVVNKNNSRAKYGVRIMSEAGNVDQGWIACLNFELGRVEWIDLQNPSNNKYAEMSSTLKSGVGGRYLVTVQKLNGRVRVIVGERVYLDFSATLPTAAYGVYAKDCVIRVYRLNVSTLDRWEPMEKFEITLDGKKYQFGEVKRNVPYDEFGYLIYTGLPGNLTEAVRAIPSESESTNGQASQVTGRKGTIFETEIVPEDWNLDYKNIPVAQVPSWLGPKTVTIEMKDPGIWLRTFYVGDSEGYSVAYNSDKIGYIRTSQMVLDYKCKGIALWTLGQEDPQVFEYISKT